MENAQQQHNFTVALIGNNGIHPMSLVSQSSTPMRYLTPPGCDPNIAILQQLAALQQQQQSFPTTAFFQSQSPQSQASYVIQNAANNTLNLFSHNNAAPFPLPPGFQFLQTSQGLQIVRVIQAQNNNNIVQVVASVNIAPANSALRQENQPPPPQHNQVPDVSVPFQNQVELLQPPAPPSVVLSSPVPPTVSTSAAPQPIQLLSQSQIMHQSWNPNGIQQVLLLSPLQNNPSNSSLIGVPLNPTTPTSAPLNLPLSVTYPSSTISASVSQGISLSQPVPTVVPNLPLPVSKGPTFVTVPPPQSPDSTQQDANQITIRETQSNIVEGVDLEEIRQFAKAFKIRRLTLGLTQTQVGRALSAREGPAYSQSAICRFEKLDLTPRSAFKILPVLKKWITETELKYKKGQRDLVEFIGPLSSSKARRKRTTFPCSILEKLNLYFEHCSHPAGEEITRLANELGYGRDVVRIWFCNKRQSLKGGGRSPKSPKIPPSPSKVV